MVMLLTPIVSICFSQLQLDFLALVVQLFNDETKVAVATPNHLVVLWRFNAKCPFALGAFRSVNRGNADRFGIHG